MRKPIALGGAVALLAGLTVGVTAAANADDRPTAAEANARADRALAAHRSDVHASDSDEFRRYSTVVDPSGAVHVRYSRSYRGLPVLGGGIVVHTDPDGGYAGVSDPLARAITVSTRPTKSAASAQTKAKRHYRGDVDQVADSRLVVDAASGVGRLAWETVVEGTAPDGVTPSMLHVLTDARTGSVVRSWDEVITFINQPVSAEAGTPGTQATASVAGTGNSLYAGQVPVDTTGSGTSYSMVDPNRGSGRTCDMNQGQGTCTTFTDSDNAWGDGTQNNRQTAGVDAHHGAALTFDYFSGTHGRNGIFGDGRGVPSRVHYGSAYVNAFWDGSQMTYGDGRNNQWPLVSIDVAGHEMAHGVTENVVEGGLTYSGESGGLNEATSDIFGAMVEFSAQNQTDPGDYDIGEKINIRGDNKPLRYMYKPSLDGNSKDCWYDGIGNIDVHYSSGPANRFFYLLAEGSDSRTGAACDGSTVTGIGRARAEKIWYKALRDYFTSNTRYVHSGGTNDARNYTLRAATDLYGQCGAEYRAVQDAWKAVNVAGEDAGCGGTPTPTASPTASPTVPPTASPTGSPTAPPSCPPVSNGTDVAIPDEGAAVTSDATFSGCSRNASATSTVEVHIRHTWRGDLVIDLIAPDGSVYPLKTAQITDMTPNVDATYRVDLSTEAANGAWKLRVRDAYRYDTGYLDTWTLTV